MEVFLQCSIVFDSSAKSRQVFMLISGFGSSIRNCNPLLRPDSDLESSSQFSCWTLSPHPYLSSEAEHAPYQPQSVSGLMSQVSLTVSGFNSL